MVAVKSIYTPPGGKAVGGNIRPIYIAVAAAIIVGAYFAARGVREAGQLLGEGAVDLVDGTVSGVVLGVGDAVGIPRTSESECEKCKRLGDVWGASFACPAADFIKWLASGRPQNGASGSW